MLNLTRFLIPILGGVGVVLTMVTILDFDDKICSSCWPVDAVMNFTYFLLGLCSLLAVVGGVVGVLAKPSSLKGSAIGVGALVLVVVISYLLATDQMMPYYPDDISSAEVKWSGVGLIMFYILFLGAGASVVFSSVYSILKR